MSSWAAIELLNISDTNAASQLENRNRVFGVKNIVITFVNFMQDGFIDILCGLLIIALFTMDLEGTPEFVVFYTTFISAISLNIAMVFRRVIKK